MSEPEHALAETAGGMDAQLPLLVEKVEAHAARQDEPLIKQLLLLLPRLVSFLSGIARAPEISAGWKLRCALVIAYVFSPVDVIPDVFLPLGLLDDLYLSLLLLDRLLNHVPEAVFLRCWSGGREVIDSMRRGVGVVSAKLPKKAREILDGFFGEAEKPAAN